MVGLIVGVYLFIFSFIYSYLTIFYNRHSFLPRKAVVSQELSVRKALVPAQQLYPTASQVTTRYYFSEKLPESDIAVHLSFQLNENSVFLILTVLNNLFSFISPLDICEELLK